MSESTAVIGGSGNGTAVDVIGRRIVSGEFKPGTLLPSTDRLAEEFAVSRPTIREAMKVLAGKGLVDARPRRGTVVRPRSDWSRLDPDVLVWQVLDAPNAAFFRNLFEARRLIEPEAAALVAGRAMPDTVAAIDAAFQEMANAAPDSPESIKADVAFHEAILAGTGNEFIAAFTSVIAAMLPVTFRIQRKAVTGRGHFVPSHGAILDAIKRGDPDGARTAFRALLDTAEIDALNGLRERNESNAG